MSRSLQSKKANKTGRNDNAGGDHWTKLHRAMMETPAWIALSTTAKALYPSLKLEWHGPHFNNNGQIRFSVRQAAKALGVTPDTASRAIHDLQAKGFLIMTEPAILGLAGAAKATTFEITELAVRGAHQGKKNYLNWQPGADFPFDKASSNNPAGWNGK